jgi:hypothetical protein
MPLRPRVPDRRARRHEASSSVARSPSVLLRPSSARGESDGLLLGAGSGWGGSVDGGGESRASVLARPLVSSAVSGSGERVVPASKDRSRDSLLSKSFWRSCT